MFLFSLKLKDKVSPEERGEILDALSQALKAALHDASLNERIDAGVTCITCKPLELLHADFPHEKIFPHDEIARRIKETVGDFFPLDLADQAA
jgi:hypothetical protein